MKCLYDCGLSHGYADPCANPESPFYDASLEFDNEPSVPKEKEGVPRPEKESQRSGGSGQLLPGDRGVADGPLTQVQRNTRWRQSHKEQYNKYMRDYRSKK